MAMGPMGEHPGYFSVTEQARSDIRKHILSHQKTYFGMTFISITYLE